MNGLEARHGAEYGQNSARRRQSTPGALADEGFEEIVARHVLRIRGIGEVAAVGICLSEQIIEWLLKRNVGGPKARNRGRADAPVILQSFRSANTAPLHSNQGAVVRPVLIYEARRAPPGRLITFPCAISVMSA